MSDKDKKSMKKSGPMPGSYEARTGKKPTRNSGPGYRGKLGKPFPTNPRKVRDPLEFYDSRLSREMEVSRKDPTSTDKNRTVGRARLQALKVMQRETAKRKNSTAFKETFKKKSDK
jgi:hypothetical protein